MRSYCPPGVALDPKLLKEMPRPQTFRGMEDENEEALESDLDPAMLKRLKQQPYVAQSMPETYSVQADGAGAKAERKVPGMGASAPAAVLSPSSRHATST